MGLCQHSRKKNKSSSLYTLPATTSRKAAEMDKGL